MTALRHGLRALAYDLAIVAVLVGAVALCHVIVRHQYREV